MKTRRFRFVHYLLLAISFSFISCGGSEKEPEGDQPEAKAVKITVKGSDTVLPLSQSEAENYMKAHPGSAITVVGGGSGVGITALADGSTDICMASRDLKTSEEIDLQEKKVTVSKVIIAYDALSIIVHPDNKVSQLTREQIEGIFTGEITNWKKVGGEDMPITAISRESSSGTYEFFKEHVMDKKNYGPGTLSQPATGAIVQSVQQSKGAIGYIGLAYETSEVKMLKVSYDQGKTYVAPSVAAAKDKTYPVARPLYYMYDLSKEASVKPFVDFVVSPEGQKIVADIGYVPL
jgi:phosphate transport system substrate-binding protein